MGWNVCCFYDGIEKVLDNEHDRKGVFFRTSHVMLSSLGSVLFYNFLIVVVSSV